MIYTQSSFMPKVDKNVYLNILAQILGGVWGHGFLFPLGFASNTFWIAWLVISSFFYTNSCANMFAQTKVESVFVM